MQRAPMEFCNFEHYQRFARNSHRFCLWIEDSCIDSESYQGKISWKKCAKFSCKAKPDQLEELFS